MPVLPEQEEVELPQPVGPVDAAEPAAQPAVVADGSEGLSPPLVAFARALFDPNVPPKRLRALLSRVLAPPRPEEVSPDVRSPSEVQVRVLGLLIRMVKIDSDEVRTTPAARKAIDQEIDDLQSLAAFDMKAPVEKAEVIRRV